MTAVSNNARPTPESQSVTDLIGRHQNELWRYARYLGAEANEADDLVQETFVGVHKRPFEQRTERESAAYLRKVLRNRLLQRRRRQGREVTTVGLEMAEQVWTENKADTHWNDHLLALEDCLQALQERSQSAVRLFYHDGLSHRQIAEQIKLAPEGVKTLLRRARHALRECIRRKTGP